VAGAVFVALFSLTFIALPAVRVSRKRLGLPQRSVSKQAVTTLDDFLERHGHRGTLATRLSTADISMAPGEFVALVLAATVVLGFAGLVVAGPLVALVLAVLVVLLARTIVSRKANKRQATFADQLPDVLQLVTSSLRAGHGMTQALDAVAEEAEEPARSEFTHVLVETRLGRDLTDSLRNLASRMNSVDLDWVASAIDIHRETGGNLSEILTTVANTIRERQRMRRQIRTLTAEGRMSARVLTALPLLLALWQWRVHPESFDVLTHGGGLVLSALAAVLMVLGWFWINRLVRIKM
jgi:tight adherence protein B